MMPGIGSIRGADYILVMASTGISDSYLACESPAPQKVFIGPWHRPW